MANFTAADVKRLREVTGAGMLDCKNALADSDGDFDKAVEVLRIKGAKDVVLLEQPSVSDSKKTVKALLDEAGVTVTRFVRFEVGQT